MCFEVFNGLDKSYLKGNVWFLRILGILGFNLVYGRYLELLKVI